METNHKGEVAKLKVELRAAEKGWVTSRTVEGARYDLVLDDGQRLHRVQVKYASGMTGHSDGSVQVPLRQNNGSAKNSRNVREKRQTYTADEVDAVLAYIPQIDSICWLGPEDFAGKTAVILRYEPPKNGQKKGIKLVQDCTW